jgi:YlmC/YmxH family sporulation protein
MSDLQTKDVVNINNGNNYGKIVDAKIDDNGYVIEFISSERKLLKKIKDFNEVKFSYKSIKKIGSDVILIDN